MTLRTTSRRAFTLIELLVVIAIIAILAAILFPVFAQAREKARQAMCISNEKQLGLAFLQYEQDYDEMLPAADQFHFIQYQNGTYTGQSQLEPYIKNHPAMSKGTVWVCPDLAKWYSGASSFGSYLCTYSMNVFLEPPNSYDPDPDACYTPPSQQYSVSWNGGGPVQGTPATYSNESNLSYNNESAADSGITLASISAPANTDLLFEAYVEDGNTGTDPYVGLSQRDGDYMNQRGFWPTQTAADQSYGYPLQPAVTPWHDSVNNYLFNDGHVKAHTPEKAGYDIQLDTNNIWLTHDGRDGGSIPNPPGGGC